MTDAAGTLQSNNEQLNTLRIVSAYLLISHLGKLKFL